MTIRFVRLSAMGINRSFMFFAARIVAIPDSYVYIIENEIQRLGNPYACTVQKSEQHWINRIPV